MPTDAYGDKYGVYMGSSLLNVVDAFYNGWTGCENGIKSGDGRPAMEFDVGSNSVEFFLPNANFNFLG